MLLISGWILFWTILGIIFAPILTLSIIFFTTGHTILGVLALIIMVLRMLNKAN